MLTTTDTNNEFDAAMHIGELSAKISQLQVTVTASDDRRDTSEAETKQTVTELRFELRRLQERYAKLLDALREQRREHLDTAKQLAALQQMSDKLFTVLCFDKDMSSIFFFREPSSGLLPAPTTTRHSACHTHSPTVTCPT